MSAMTYQRTFPASATAPVRHRARACTTARPARPVATTASPARLTRRGRLVVVLVLATLTLIAFSLGRASSSDASRGAGRPASPRPTTVVQPGDTLWSIARRIEPGADPRVMVDRIARLNDLGGRPIQSGQQLTLPYPR